MVQKQPAHSDCSSYFGPPFFLGHDPQDCAQKGGQKDMRRIIRLFWPPLLIRIQNGNVSPVEIIRSLLRLGGGGPQKGVQNVLLEL